MIVFLIFRSWLRGVFFKDFRGETSFSLFLSITINEIKQQILFLFGLAVRSYTIKNDEFIWRYRNEKFPCTETMTFLKQKKCPYALGYFVRQVLLLKNESTNMEPKK